ncbi:MAG: TonB-dependent receptor [Chitinophagaceae bacterium]|nr:TonB-dependent receptor [Chitinophagaceae bacterium]
MLNKVLRFILIFTFFVAGPKVQAQQTTGDIKVSLSFSRAALKDILQHLETITPFRFQAAAELIEPVKNIDINVSNQSLDKVLNQLLAPAKLRYVQSGINIIIRRVEVRGQQNARSGNATVHGVVRSGRTGETVIGATISVVETGAGTTTNEYGFFSLTMPRGNYTLAVSAVGMQTTQTHISLIGDSEKQISLEEDTTSLEAVTVTAATPTSIRGPQMGVEKINVKDVKNIPVIFGERDILKSMQLLPGIKQVAEGGSGFYVRGGAADQNLILLDEAPVYNASHLLGFFSTFNSDAIKNVTVYKGGMPANYGGRLSSVVDIKMNDGNNQDMSVSGGIGLIASRLNIEGPIQKGRSSFLVSARRTYADLFLKLLGDSSLKTTKLNFYDLNAKFNVILGDKDRIYLSGYFGRDVLGQEKLAGIDWGNATGTLRWNHVFNKKLFSNTSLIFSNYDYKIRINSESTDYRILSRIRDWNVKEEMQWYAGTGSTVKFGLNSIYHTIRPGEISVAGNTGTVTQGLPDRFSYENAVYADHSYKPTDRLSLAYGLRVSFFSIVGGGDYYNLDNNGQVIDTIKYGKGDIVKTYVNAEPRVSVGYEINDRSSVKASYTRNSQNLHLISNSTAGSPTDKWVASTNIIKPEIADQVALGWYRAISGDRYELSTELYYKNMMNQIDYRNGAKVFTNDPIETQLLYGKGRAYGLEMLLKKKTGRFTGWLSYTLSKTERKIEGINDGKWYNARQDRTHDIAIVGMYQLNPKWVLGATFVYYTGDAVTYPGGKYTLDGEVYFYYSERNGYRMPAYHRLDLSATRYLKKTNRFSSELSFSLFNAYGHANAYQITFREGKDNPDITEAVQTSLFTFVPSISWNFKF